jgi:rhamnogalacturonan endolyase
MRTLLLSLLCVLPLLSSTPAAAGTWEAVGPDSLVVFEDDFSGYPVGPLSEPYTAVQEYHWVSKNPDWGPWIEAVYWGFFGPEGGGLAWHIREVEGRKVLHQMHDILAEDKNAVVVTGDEQWTDYVYEVELAPLSHENPVGIIYRVANSRNYFMITLEEDHKWVWSRRRHQAWEKLKIRTVPYQTGEPHTLRVEVNDRNHTFFVDGKRIDITRRDHHHPSGRVGLLCNSPCDFRRVRVIMSNQAHQDYLRRKAERRSLEDELSRKYPQPELWKKVDLKKLAVNGRQMRWGDLDGDGRLDFVIAQRHRGSSGLLRRYIRGMSAFNLDGDILWQWGENDTIPELFATDLPFQVCDLDRDGRAEVILSYDFKIEVLDGMTGETISSVPTPRHGPKHPDSFYPEDKWERIPAGALHFCDLTGSGSAGDFLIKDDYNNIWAYSREFKQLWTACLNAGHYPFCRDIDNDGLDEILQGYTLFDHDGTVLFDLGMQDHSDAGFIGESGDECFTGMHAYFCAGEEGVIVSDMQGKVRYKEIVGHAQRAAIGDFFPEVPGLEFAQATYWGEHNLITVHASDGRKLGEYQPHFIGSTLAATDWAGDGTALLLLSGDEKLGGMVDGWGRQVVRFTDPGHPVLCCDVIDLTGDSRDEVLLWDRDRLWIYTQGGNVTAPEKPVPMYKMPLHSRSNYQISAAVPER